MGLICGYAGCVASGCFKCEYSYICATETKCRPCSLNCIYKDLHNSFVADISLFLTTKLLFCSSGHHRLFLVPRCLGMLVSPSPSLLSMPPRCTAQRQTNMRFVDLDDSISRFRFSQSCVGITGCLCVSYAVWTPFWINDRGLWTEGNITRMAQRIRENGNIFNALEAERVFGVLSFLMAVSTAALCGLFALCWTSQTVRSFSNTRSLLMAQQALYPTTLLLLTMGSTGFFFLLSWSFFTHQHREEMGEHLSGLGSSFWLGALGWVLLLVVEPIVFMAEQVIVPDVIPDLEKAVEWWAISSQHKPTQQSLSDGDHPVDNEGLMNPTRFASEP